MSNALKLVALLGATALAGRYYGFSKVRRIRPGQAYRLTYEVRPKLPDESELATMMAQDSNLSDVTIDHEPDSSAVAWTWTAPDAEPLIVGSSSDMLGHVLTLKSVRAVS